MSGSHATNEATNTGPVQGFSADLSTGCVNAGLCELFVESRG